MTWYSLAINERIIKIVDALLPLPCFEYLQKTGGCDQFSCPESEGEPLCQQRGRIARSLALAAQVNIYDPLHPEFSGISQKENALLEKVIELRGQELPRRMTYMHGSQ